MSNQTKNEQDNDKKCPPGMEPDGKGGCRAKGESNKEDSNAGGTTSAGTGTIVSASTKGDDMARKCPPGTTLGPDGECKPSGDAGSNSYP